MSTNLDQWDEFAQSSSEDPDLREGRDRGNGPGYDAYDNIRTRKWYDKNIPNGLKWSVLDNRKDNQSVPENP